MTEVDLTTVVVISAATFSLLKQLYIFEDSFIRITSMNGTSNSVMSYPNFRNVVLSFVLCVFTIQYVPKDLYIPAPLS